VVKRETAEEERASLKGEFLPPLVAFFSDEVDDLDFSESEFGHIDLRKE
jgi:hypothetical protein